MKETYVIVIFSSDETMVSEKMFGDVDAVKDYVMSLINNDRENPDTADSFDFGTGSKAELVNDGDRGFHGFNTFFDYSVYYVATRYDDMPIVNNR